MYSAQILSVENLIIGALTWKPKTSIASSIKETSLEYNACYFSELS